MNIDKAYEMVYEDMLSRGPNLFFGTYDAVNGNKKFMYGVNLVMEYIATRADSLDEYDEIFTTNMERSRERAKC